LRIYLITYTFLLFKKQKTLDSMKIESEKCLKIKKILLPRSASFRFDSMLYEFVHKFDGVTVVYKGFTVFNNSWIKRICNNPKVKNFKDDFDDDNNIDEFNDVKN